MITAEKAEQIAKSLADAVGWRWITPVSVRETTTSWKVVTNRGKRGMNIRISIDKNSGRLLSAIYPASNGIRTLSDIRIRLSDRADIQKLVDPGNDETVAN